MPTDADLKTIELGALNAQVRIGYVPPAAGDLQRLRTSGRNQDASAAASYEIESGSIALGKIDTRAQPASAEFNEWRDLRRGRGLEFQRRMTGSKAVPVIFRRAN